MSQSNLHPRAWIWSCTTQAICLAAAFFVTARASPSIMVEVPETLAPTPSESLAMIVAATGVQIHECHAAKGAPAAYESVTSPATPCTS